ncbi:MAG: glycosyltransferase family 4 protein [Fusobacteriaceae bacterium]
MKKIGFVDVVGNGLFNFRGGIIKKLCEEGNEVYIIAPEFKESEEMKSWGCKHIILDIERIGKNMLKDIKTIIELKKNYSRLKLDLVFHYSIKPNIYGGIAAQLSRTKYISVIPGAGRMFSSKNYKRKIAALMYQVGLRKTEKVLFLNNNDLEEFISLKICDMSKSINLRSEGVNISRFAPIKKIVFNKIKFIMISRVIEEKGVFYYLEAAKLLNKKYKNIEFYFLGGLGEISLDEFEEKTKESGVTYLGVVDNVEKILEKMNCLVLPSFYREGVPRTLLEAGAMGLPLITTDNIGCKEVVDDNINGYKCEVKNVEDLEKKIEKFIKLSNKEKLEMGKKSREKIEVEFNENRIINEYMELIKM